MLTTLNDHVLEFLENNDSENLLKKWKSKTNQDSLKLLIKTECPKKTKKVKDPDAPSKNKSAYMIFCQEKRAEVTAKGITGQLIFTHLGAMWKECSGDKNSRCFKEYQQKATIDLNRYKREMEAYKNS